MSKLSLTVVRLTCSVTLMATLLISSIHPAFAFTSLPNLPINACNNSSLPKDWGTNYPNPNDPFSLGFPNVAAIGWTGNYYAPFEYLSGSFFARGVPVTYVSGSTTYCGGMYEFTVYTNGGNPTAGSVQWTMDGGYLPALTSSWTKNSVAFKITNFADKVTIGTSAFELVYSRVSITNNGSTTVTIDPGMTGSNRATLTSPSNTLTAGQSANHDYVVAVDNFGSGVALPTAATLVSSAPSYATAYQDMNTYWSSLLSGAPVFSLPNITLPNTNNLANPGTALSNAYKAAFVYTHIFQVANAPFSAANNYNYLLNHDVPGILVNRFVQGDYTNAQDLLLNGRISEQVNFNEQGANWYYDGIWKTPWAWAEYLAKTNDTAFVSQFFNDTQTQWGPSLFNMFHTIYTGQLNASGYLKSSFDNDSSGVWLFDDYSALIGLAGYKYIATRLGNSTEATWADQQMTSLMNATNTAVAAAQSSGGFTYLPCVVNQANSGNRCNTNNDANWGGNNLFGQNGWDAMLMGVPLSGVLGNQTMVDNTLDFGYGRLNGVLPYPTTGAFNGYTTAYLTSYAQGGLFSNKYRDLAITAYAWQLGMTTGGPNAWWEDVASAPSSSNPWAGSHGMPGWGACPYGWPLSGQALTLLDSIVGEGLAATPSGGSFNFTRPLYIGRGIPNPWIVAGQTIAVNNITNSYDISAGTRSTYSVSLAVTKPASARVITVNLGGSVPTGTQYISLPIFFTVPPATVTGGTYDANSKTVTVNSGATQVVITLNEGGTATATPTPQPTFQPPTNTPSGPTATPSTGPSVWYKFDGNANDSSGNGKTATLVNGPTFVTGKNGQAVNIAAGTQYVSLPAGIVNGMTNFSVATWVNLTSVATWARIFDFGTGTTVNMFLTPTAGSTIRFAITTSGSGGEQRINGTAPLTTGWHHVAVTKSGNTGTLYVDGVQVGQNTAMTLSPSSLGNTTQNYIGKSQYTTDPDLNGAVDQFQIYNRALSAAEVQSLFQNP